MLWEWDQAKNRANLQAHGIEFDTAILVFDDPLAATVPDPHPDEERWRTMGVAGTTLIMVVHTSPEGDSEKGEEVGRIISARKLTPRERRLYEEEHV